MITLWFILCAGPGMSGECQEPKMLAKAEEMAQCDARRNLYLEILGPEENYQLLCRRPGEPVVIVRGRDAGTQL